MKANEYINLQQLEEKGFAADSQQTERFIGLAEQLETDIIANYQQMVTEHAQQLFVTIGGLILDSANHWDQLDRQRQRWYLQAAQRNLTEDYLDCYSFEV
jgi:hypothetical protein